MGGRRGGQFQRKEEVSDRSRDILIKAIPDEVISKAILTYLDDVDLTNLLRTGNPRVKKTSSKQLTGFKMLIFGGMLFNSNMKSEIVTAYIDEPQILGAKNFNMQFP